MIVHYDLVDRFHAKINRFKMLGSSEEDKENKQCLVSYKTSLDSECDCSWERFTASLAAIFPGNCEIFIFSWILGQGTALVECTLETKPLERNTDYAVSLKVEPVEMIYDSVSYMEICPPSYEVFCRFVFCMESETLY